MFVALCTLALAAELHPGRLLPGAVSADAGEGYVGTGFLLDFGDTGEGAALTANAAYAPTDRMAATVSLVAGAAGTVGHVGVRYNVFDRRWLRAAPTMHVRSWEEGGEARTGGGVGVALDVGARRVRFDLAAPVVVLGEDGLESPARMPACGGLETGLTLRLGDAQANQLRASAGRDHVAFGYRYAGERWFLDSQGFVGAHTGMFVMGGVAF